VIPAWALVLLCVAVVLLGLAVVLLWVVVLRLGREVRWWNGWADEVHEWMSGVEEG
jgi:hypothetical protein